MKKLIENIEKLGYQIKSAGYNSEDDIINNNHTWREWQIPKRNRELVNTAFYYKKRKDFLHFTSLENALSILNEQHIRLYNLVNMDDKFELDYAKKELNFHNRPDDAKENIFSLSMCASDEIFSDSSKEHLLWKLYGRNGYGAILRLSFESNMTLWESYYLAKMFYDLKNFTAIKELNEKTDNEYLDPLVASFVKLPIYSFEEEIRLIYDNRNPIKVTNHGKLTYPLIFKDKIESPNNIQYIKLPLLNFFKNHSTYVPYSGDWDIDPELPKIKIVEVILGYRHSEDELNSIKEIIKTKLSPLEIPVRLTPLKKFF